MLVAERRSFLTTSCASATRLESGGHRPAHQHPRKQGRQMGTRNRHWHDAAHVISMEPGVGAYEFEWCGCGAIKLSSDPKNWREPDGLPWDVNGPATAVFCRFGALTGALDQDALLHTGIHLENGECIDPIDARKLLGLDPHVHIFTTEFPDTPIKPGDLLRCGCGATTEYKS